MAGTAVTWLSWSGSLAGLALGIKMKKKKKQPAFKIMELPGKVYFMIHFVGSIYFSLFVKGVYHAWCISPH